MKFEERGETPPNNTLREVLLDKVFEVSSRNLTTWEKKKKFIGALPEDFIVEMHAHLQSGDAEHAEYLRNEGREEKIRPWSELSDEEKLEQERIMKGILFGEVFERLVQKELAEILQMSPKDMELAQEATMLLHNPARHNLETSGRNPDLTIVDIKTGKIVELVEAKTGNFDERAYKQMMGYKRHITQTIDQIGEAREEAQESLEKEGTPVTTENMEQYLRRNYGLSSEITRLGVVDDLKRTFIVPSDRRTDRPEGLIKTSNSRGYDSVFRNPQNRRDFERLLRNKEIEVIRSIFSTKEINAITDVVLEAIKKRIEAQSKDFAKQQAEEKAKQGTKLG